VKRTQRAHVIENAHGGIRIRGEPAADTFHRRRTDRHDISAVFAKIGAVLAPTTVLAALMYYFGWVRIHAFYAYFGIDADELSLSNTDYVLRSAPALWPSLVVLAIVAVAFLFLNRLVTPLLQRSPRLRRYTTIALVVLGTGLLAVCAAKIVSPSPQDSPIPAVGLAAGFTVLAYAGYVSWSLPDELEQREQRTREPAERGIFALLAILIVLSTFWATALFADAVGQRLATRLERENFDSTPDVILYSSHRLHIDARDITERDFGQQYATFRYRYDGFKLLARGSGKIVLIPYSWSTSNPYALVLPETANIAIVFAPNF
jgi:hypothetical protein